jgi:hypothetical protein
MMAVGVIVMIVLAVIIIIPLYILNEIVNVCKSKKSKLLQDDILTPIKEVRQITRKKAQEQIEYLKRNS